MIEVSIKVSGLTVAEVKLPDPPLDGENLSFGRRPTRSDVTALHVRTDAVVRMASEATRLHFASVLAQIPEEGA